MKPRILENVGSSQVLSGLIAGNRLVLCSVILPDALDVLESRSIDEIEKEYQKPQETFDQIEHELHPLKMNDILRDKPGDQINDEPRKEYEQANAEKDSPTMFLKVYRKNTMMKGLGGDTSPYPQECFIDIFPIEGIPENRIIRKLKGLLANAIRLIANMVAENVPLAEWEKELYSADKSLFRLMYG